jgi:hypothetical protein
MTSKSKWGNPTITCEHNLDSKASLSQKLTVEYGIGFAEKNLRKMIQFAEVFPDEKIVVSLMRQLTWTHFLMLIPIKTPSSATSTPKCAE